ncbi:MAG TPA: protein-methionine-sulfoxide reductase heme-binding subunit MsrQ [Myxococcaceae bacterium]|nr:protein-methionine-sulfoxide reductase heme-binding subunit MsrQ [Myxococcaceae bacterium]
MKQRTRAVPLPWLKPAVLTGSLVPLGALVLRAAVGELGSNPISEALNALGLLALIFLVASLACTPAKVLFGWTWPIRIRRMLGVLAFVYALLHFLTYAVLDQGLDLATLWEDVTKRKFIFVGFAALLLLLPLTLTSTDSSVKRLGYVRWKRLHRLAYLAGGLGVIHYVWRVKADLTEPVVYGLILGGLLLVRVIDFLRSGRRKPKPRVAAKA